MSGHPNILWIQCDEIRVDALSCYPGNPWVQPRTPCIQRLADEGVVFGDMFCPSPVCMPSRGCEMTSQYATTLGVYHNVTQRHRDSYHFDVSWPTWPEALREGGYHAVNVGKVHTVPYDVWDENLGCRQFPAQRNLVQAEPPGAGLVVLPGIQLAVGGTYPLPGDDYEAFGARRLTRLALRKLGELASGHDPWLLRVSYIAPHTPVVAPPPFDTLHDRERCGFDPRRDRAHAGMSAYERAISAVQGSAQLSPAEVGRARATHYGLVSAIDAEVGLLLADLPDDTIVLFTGDHGTMLGEGGLWQKQAFNRRVHQVPYVVRAPGLAPGRREDSADLLDSGPTLLGLCGVHVPECFQGRDLFADDTAPKDIFAAFGFGDQGAFLYEALQKGPDCPRRICIRSGPERLDLSVMRGGERLGEDGEDLFFCDSREDPEERVNAAGAPRFGGRVRELRRRLLDWYEGTAV